MNTDNTKLTLEHDGKKYTAELNWDCDCEGLLDAFLGLTVCATQPYKNMLVTMKEWAESQLDAYFPNRGEQFSFFILVGDGFMAILFCFTNFVIFLARKHSFCVINVKFQNRALYLNNKN